MLQTQPVGRRPEIKRTHNAKVVIPAMVGASSFATVEAGASSMEILAKPELPPKSTPEIFVSFAWGDDSSDDARKRGEVVDRLCERLDKGGWNILRDSNVLRSGALISGFMKRIGLAGCRDGEAFFKPFSTLFVVTRSLIHKRDVDTRTRLVNLHRRGRARVLLWPGKGCRLKRSIPGKIKSDGLLCKILP
jgi:hypothetical protein